MKMTSQILQSHASKACPQDIQAACSSSSSWHVSASVQGSSFMLQVSATCMSILLSQIAWPNAAMPAGRANASSVMARKGGDPARSFNACAMEACVERGFEADGRHLYVPNSWVENCHPTVWSTLWPFLRSPVGMLAACRTIALGRSRLKSLSCAVGAKRPGLGHAACMTGAHLTR